MARPMSLNGGKTPTFPRHISDGLLDLRALRNEIEEAEGLSESASQPIAARRQWRAYRDHLECALDVRIELLQRSTESHERAISGQVMPMCRQYEACDPSHRELCAIAQKRIAVASCGSDGDVA